MFSGIVITVLLLLTGHWLPWFRRLTRIQAYIYGTAAILAGQGVWLGFDSPMFWQLASFAVAGGVAVVVAYQIDVWLNRRARRHRGEYGSSGGTR